MKKLPLLLTLLLVACGGGEMVVDGVWGRVSPMAAQNGAFYLQIENQTGQDDALTVVRTAACGTVELHESMMDDNGVMRMAPVPGGEIPLPDGETAELKVGGLHVMCIDKQTDFREGAFIPLTLVFANADEMNVEAEIRRDAP